MQPARTPGVAQLGAPRVPSPRHPRRHAAPRRGGGGRGGGGRHAVALPAEFDDGHSPGRPVHFAVGYGGFWTVAETKTLDVIYYFCCSVFVRRT